LGAALNSAPHFSVSAATIPMKHKKTPRHQRRILIMVLFSMPLERALFLVYYRFYCFAPMPFVWDYRVWQFAMERMAARTGQPPDYQIRFSGFVPEPYSARLAVPHFQRALTYRAHCFFFGADMHPAFFVCPFLII